MFHRVHKSWEGEGDSGAVLPSGRAARDDIMERWEGNDEGECVRERDLGWFLRRLQLGHLLKGA